jgi:sodium-dependent phosphate cotransporter
MDGERQVNRIVRRVALGLALAALLYFFLVSIGLVGASFKLMGKDLAKQVFEFASHPLCGLFIGILATSLVQSSSTTTSIVVGLVGAGEMSVGSAVPIIMGANIGTSVTNTIVSIGHISRSNEFKRAFAAATVHDFFNLLAVLILFPLEYFTQFLSRSATWLGGMVTGGKDVQFDSPVKAIIKPTTHWIGEMAAMLSESNAVQAAILIAVAGVLLFFSLKYMSALMRGAVVEKASGFFERTVFKTPYLAFSVGVVLTAIVQSSSVTTSMVIPLAGAGILTLRQIYPYTLGANVGTTITALLASFAATQDFQAAVSVAISHLLFNVIGIAVITPFRPIRALPIRVAEGLAERSLNRRWLPLVYVLVVFFAIPGLLILLTR